MKVLKNAVIMLVIGFVLEVGYFQFPTLYNCFCGKTPQKEYVLSQMQPINWHMDGAFWVSESDPAHIITNINCYVNTLDVYFDSKSEVNGVTVFYTNDTYPEIEDNTTIHISGLIDEHFRINVKDNVDDMRIDIGEEAGMELHDAKIVVNNRKFELSYSRILLLMMVYVLGAGLFRLQKMPDYKVEDISRKEDGDDLQ